MYNEFAPTADTLFLLVLSTLTLESVHSIRFLYQHFLSGITTKSLNTFYHACSYAKVDYSHFMNITAKVALRIVVPGNEIGEVGDMGERFMDNQRIEGNIAEMLDGAIQFVNRNMRVKTIVDSETGKRKDRTDYPITADIPVTDSKIRYLSTFCASQDRVPSLSTVQFLMTYARQNHLPY